MLQALVGDRLKQWGPILSYTEFSFNRTPNRTIGFCPFEVVYGRVPNGVLELAHIPFTGKKSKKVDELINDMGLLHKLVQQRIHESNAKYKAAADHHRRHVVFEVGDFVWAVLT